MESNELKEEVTRVTSGVMYRVTSGVVPKHAHTCTSVSVGITDDETQEATEDESSGR